jgi:hypothetical protein
MDTGATTASSRACAATSWSSSADSTLSDLMPVSSAARISSFVLPTPEKTIRSAGTPARSAFASSPPETTSAPRPSSAAAWSSASASFALTA